VNLLTPRQAAAHCGIHYRTFLDIARTEGLRPAGRIGARNRYTTAQLDKFMETLRQRHDQTRLRRTA
jgi:hypothetical protein